MPKPKIGINKDGKKIHYGVGALIKKNDKYLLIDRANIPYGFAGPAGHIDEGENEEIALTREIEEEVGLKITKYKKIIDEFVEWNYCSKNVTGHHWYVFNCEVEGKISRNLRETKSIDWYTIEEIKKLKLEPVWEYWFKKLNLI